MRALLVALFVALFVVTTGAIAHAESCSRLRVPSSYASLPERVKERLPTSNWDNAQPRDWRHVTITVTLARAPHLARAIVQDCPGIRADGDAEPNDVRHFESSIAIRAPSYATVLRLMLLPAVIEVVIYDTTDSQLSIPEPFE